MIKYVFFIIILVALAGMVLKFSNITGKYSVYQSHDTIIIPSYNSPSFYTGTNPTPCELLGCVYGTEYVGVIGENKFYKCNCRNINDLRKTGDFRKNRDFQCFFSIEKAISAGYEAGACEELQIRSVITPELSKGGMFELPR